MNLAWLTDIHLNFLRPPAQEAFLDVLAGTEADAFVITGDIAEAHDIAGHLTVSPHTVKTHVNRTMTKLGAHDRAQLVVIAYETGLVRPVRP